MPCQGSVGASGDLAPLAHMTLTLIGEGEAFFRGERMPSAAALERAGLQPVTLGAKEGLALINGTQVMTAIGALGVLRAERLAAAADVIGAMSLEAFHGSERVFDRRLNDCGRIRGRCGSQKNLRALLAGSQIVQSHAECGRVQDPYSFRCIPVVHGAVRDSIAHVRRVTEIEANSVTDNPLVFPDDGEFLSGGNFHGEPIALAIDFLKFAISRTRLDRRAAALPACSTRRIAAAALPDGAFGFAVGSDDRAVYRRGARQRQQGAGVAVERRFDSDVGRPRGSREYGHDVGEQSERVLDNVEGALACELLGALVATDLRRPLRSGARNPRRTRRSRAVRSRRGPRIARRPPTSPSPATSSPPATQPPPPPCHPERSRCHPERSRVAAQSKDAYVILSGAAERRSRRTAPNQE